MLKNGSVKPIQFQMHGMFFCQYQISGRKLRFSDAEKPLYSATLRLLYLAVG